MIWEIKLNIKIFNNKLIKYFNIILNRVKLLNMSKINS